MAFNYDGADDDDGDGGDGGDDEIAMIFNQWTGLHSCSRLPFI